MKLGRHLSNIFDHRGPNAEAMFTYSYHAWIEKSDGPRKREWNSHLRWINENMIGPPKETDHYGSQELKDQGMIGIYAKD